MGSDPTSFEPVYGRARYQACPSASPHSVSARQLRVIWGEAVAFGEIDGIRVGTHFERRADVAAAGVHRAPIAGIVGRPETGADETSAAGRSPADQVS